VGDGTEATGSTKFVTMRSGMLHGFGAFFNTTLADGIALSNSRARDTSWSQAFLPLEVPVQLRSGAEVNVELQMDDGRAWRWRGDADGEAFDQTTWLSMPPPETR
jgi:hypothetical protein